METQAISVWEIKSFDLIILRGRRERTWRLFRWNERISRIN